MRLKIVAVLSVLMLIGILAGCQQQRATAPAVENIEQSFEQAGLQDVDVETNEEQQVIRLTGEVETQSAKQQAAQIAQQAAPGYTVANEILVQPEGAMGDRAEEVAEHTDDAIESRLQAEMTQRQWTNQDVDYEVNNGVVTITGDVTSQQQRSQFEEMAKNIPGVKQVVNQLEVEGSPTAARE